MKKNPATAAPAVDELVSIGYISRAHGIRGELVFVLTSEDESLVTGSVFLRHRNGGPVLPFTALGSRVHHGNHILRLREVQNRTEAESLKSHAVLVSRDRLPPLEDDELYLSDLPGLAVYVDDGGQGTLLGRIEKAEAPAGQVLWSIRTAEGAEVLFPAVDAFVLSIDLAERRALIAPPPGLLDLYLES